jgi:hypothetical protein
MMSHFIVLTPSSSNPKLPSPRVVRSATMLRCFEPYFSFPRSESLQKLVPA